MVIAITMKQNLTPFEALTQAVEVAGGQTALAAICDISQTAVWKWLQSSKRMPAEYVLRTEAATGISRHDLRPDIYPRERIVDRMVGHRFEGVDRHSASPVAQANTSSRTTLRCDFNRVGETKVAAQ